MVTIAPFKSKSHQELPLRVALYDDLLCRHVTDVLGVCQWMFVLLYTLNRGLFQRLWVFNGKDREGLMKLVSGEWPLCKVGVPYLLEPEYSSILLSYITIAEHRLQHKDDATSKCSKPLGNTHTRPWKSSNIPMEWSLRNRMLGEGCVLFPYG